MHEGGNCVISLTFKGSTMIHLVEMIKPMRCLDVTQKMHLCGFK
jgi:hypothetical protein